MSVANIPFLHQECRIIPENDDPVRLALFQAIQKCNRQDKVAQMVHGKVILNTVGAQRPNIASDTTIVDQNMKGKSARREFLGRLLCLFQVVQIQL